MSNIKDEKTTLNNYPVYFPNKLLILGKTFYPKINELFSYKVIYLYPDENNIEEIKDIIEFRKCPNFDHKLLYFNCFNPIDNYKITFIMICHYCNIMFILSGRYNTKIKYQRAFEYFKKLNTNKRLKNEW